MSVPTKSPRAPPRPSGQPEFQCGIDVLDHPLEAALPVESAKFSRSHHQRSIRCAPTHVFIPSHRHRRWGRPPHDMVAGGVEQSGQNTRSQEANISTVRRQRLTHRDQPNPHVSDVNMCGVTSIALYEGDLSSPPRGERTRRMRPVGYGAPPPRTPT